jgi:hypothetical protein
VFQQIKKLSTNHPAESLDWKQKVGPCSNPAAVIHRQSTGRDKTMQMKMVFERLVPGVKPSDDPHRSAKTPLTKLKECFADGFKENS